MGQITSLFVWKVLRQTSDGIDQRKLLSSVGIDADAPVDPAYMIDDDAYYSLLERIARTDPGALDLPLRTGASMRCDDYGAFGLAFKTAVDLRHSWTRAERYARVLTSVSRYELRQAQDTATLVLLRDGERRLGLRLSNEATLAAVVSLSREVSTRPFTPSVVSLRHGAPANTAAHRAFFGCAVHVGAELDAITVAKDALDTPNRLGDASVSQFFDGHLRAQLDAQGDDDGAPALASQVQSVIARALSEGVPTLTHTARALGLSARTLQRRLAAQDLRYQHLVDRARQHVAEKLLGETDYSLAEIAFLTGFSEQSAFNRAFRRWSGQTPRSYRLSGSPR
ncbi:MAG: AraC family transcriptional regulator [Pseudomonadota bacterium]